MTWTLSPRSESRLVGVHSDLVRVVRRAAKTCPLQFQISEGLRTAERQQELVAQGKSMTMDGRHLTGHAVDVVVIIDGKADWTFVNYETVAGHMKRAAAELGVAITWGGDWPRLRDGPHFELDRVRYPAMAGR